MRDSQPSRKGFGMLGTKILSLVSLSFLLKLPRKASAKKRKKLKKPSDLWKIFARTIWRWELKTEKTEKLRCSLSHYGLTTGVWYRFVFEVSDTRYPVAYLVSDTDTRYLRIWYRIPDDEFG
jgi:hypothetical protein